jgi:hypothetical protein
VRGLTGPRQTAEARRFNVFGDPTLSRTSSAARGRVQTAERVNLQ